MLNRSTKTALLMLALTLAVPLVGCRGQKPPAKEEHKPGDGHDHDEKEKKEKKEEHKPGDGHDDHGSATPVKK